ncbi:polysaccharide pyruvyl transferase family protein [Extibacter muris]|uniref:polysaccharide pyruvyl transferase family protein n=1 Tax=Extibacter muris TaxID=1796622 RepID=UPI001D07BC77|nr:polysaccharide pyruvyl transferase family protein [Extibacter muris]MCB6202638.1 polysaccharide pyruvyl transferase family protein [Extibacter muris]MCQ4663875.1 polysaccharide pyruvyl transferase family protein [Extibacter muris]MCQ4693441.1 polysaccharide pyruvyl transferase family protein [Extibacter muris]
MEKCGIITLYHKNYNYGGILQAYAMVKVMEKLGYDTEVIDYCQNYKDLVIHKIKKLQMSEIISILKRKAGLKAIHLTTPHIRAGISNRVENFEKFMEKIPHSASYDESSIKECRDNYNIIVAGSDQIWNPGSWNDIYFLKFAGKKTKKISYAASMGVELLTDKEAEYLQYAVEGLDAISVREYEAKKIIEQNCSRQCVVSLDPTLLLSGDEWKKVGSGSDERKYERYAFVYLVGVDKKQRKAIRDYCDKERIKILSIPHAQGHYKKEDEHFAHIKMYEAGPREWLSLIDNAHIVFTDSFHGLCFSLLFHKKFVVLDRTDTSGKKTVNNNRQKGLLKKTGLSEHKTDACVENFRQVLRREINWKYIDEQLRIQREHSLQYLRENTRRE